MPTSLDGPAAVGQPGRQGSLRQLHAGLDGQAVSTHACIRPCTREMQRPINTGGGQALKGGSDTALKCSADVSWKPIGWGVVQFAKTVER